MLVYQCIQGSGTMGEPDMLKHQAVHHEVGSIYAQPHPCCAQTAIGAGIWTRDMKQRTNLQQASLLCTFAC
jgi:hypothetical protein